MKKNVINVDFSPDKRGQKDSAEFSFMQKIKNLFLFFKRKSNLKSTSNNYKHIL